MSSIGAISRRNAAWASAIVPPLESTAPVRGASTTVAATDPIPIRTSFPRTAAIMIFEIAWARRVPTFRHHCLPSTRGISIAVINSPGFRTLWR